MPNRVLVTGAANIGKAGVATIVYKWGQHFDSDVFVYDYLMQSGLPDVKYQNAIKAKGGKIYTCESKSYLGIINWVSKVIKDNNYKYLHINSDSAYIATAYIIAAKRAGLNNIYVHSHCTRIDDSNSFMRFLKTCAHYIFRPYVCNNTKLYLACSELAGKWMFGQKNVQSDLYRTIYNGVEVDSFQFNSEKRESTRSELGLDNETTLLNVGRLSYQKNQDFLIDVFYNYHKLNSHSKLIIVGDGELEEPLKNKVKDLGLDKAVVFTGLRNDVDRILSASDLFVMTSRFEGLPVTMVEAQMSALPCIVSDAITKESQFTDKVTFVKGWNIEDWIEAINHYSDIPREAVSSDIVNSKFNIEVAAKQLENVFK